MNAAVIRQDHPAMIMLRRDLGTQIGGIHRKAIQPGLLADLVCKALLDRIVVGRPRQLDATRPVQITIDAVLGNQRFGELKSGTGLGKDRICRPGPMGLCQHIP